MFLLGRIVRSRPRLLAGIVVGFIVWLLMPRSLRPTTAALIGWDAGVLTYLGLAAHLFLTEAPEKMPANAEAQEEGERTIFAITLAVVVASFVAIGSQFAIVKDEQGAFHTLYVGLIALTLFASWMMTHVTFAFRYAHAFYADDRGGPGVDGGLEFPSEIEPDYMDFFYFSLVLGMTFQVSDVQITSRKLRRVATMHGLLSFLFNTVILALTINIAAGLAG